MKDPSNKIQTEKVVRMVAQRTASLTLEYLKKQSTPAFAPDIVRSIGSTEATVLRALTALIGDGRVRVITRGRFRLFELAKPAVKTKANATVVRVGGETSET